jgi:CRISPR system Cascade subunit CasC
MLADDASLNVNAACQVAHAISTNSIHSMEFDYYTAVDDINNDNPGADMIGTVEFNSACFYRYANLDLDQLNTNLQGDAGLARKTAEAFLRASVEAMPTGKQNSFAAHNPPSLVFAVVRTGPPVSLANAFVKPVRPTDKLDLVSASVADLDSYYGRHTKMYGSGGLTGSAVCHCTAASLTHLKEEVESVGKLVATVVSAAFPSGGAK